MIKFIWLGQAGLLIKTDKKTILVDPYLSDSVEKINPKSKRRVPVDKSLFEVKPDIILLTHNHLDHTDPKTLVHYLTEDSKILVLASGNAWVTARKFGGENNYVLFNKGTIWTEGNISFCAVPAEHSDREAIGVIITYDGKNYYITGDTLYNEGIFEHLPKDIEVIFLPINGVGNNMNITDAKSFVKRSGARLSVPVHFGMFDDINPEDFNLENAVIPKPYKEIL